MGENKSGSLSMTHGVPHGSIFGPLSINKMEKKKKKEQKSLPILNPEGSRHKNKVRNLEVLIDPDLSFSSHIKTVTKTAIYHLKQI